MRSNLAPAVPLATCACPEPVLDSGSPCDSPLNQLDPEEKKEKDLEVISISKANIKLQLGSISR